MYTKSEKQKMLAGELYNALDPELVAERRSAHALTRLFNATTEDDDRESILRRLFGRAEGGVSVEPPFMCDYGRYIYLGSNVYMNYGCVILDCNEVRIGDNAMIGPYVQIYAAYHPVNAAERVKGPELSSPVRIGDNVWIGGGAIILPGVSIGAGSTVGAGAVVTHDVPSGVIAAGNPARVIREIR